MKIDFDKNEIYDELLLPTVNEIRRICNENHIPCFLAFGTEMKDGRFVQGEGMRCTALLPQVLGIDTDDSFFAEFVNVMNGAKTVYSQQEVVEDDEYDVPDVDFGENIEE